MFGVFAAKTATDEDASEAPHQKTNICSKQRIVCLGLTTVRGAAPSRCYGPIPPHQDSLVVAVKEQGSATTEMDELPQMKKNGQVGPSSGLTRHSVRDSMLVEEQGSYMRASPHICKHLRI